MVKEKTSVKCRFSRECLFFLETMPNLPPMAELFKMDFCRGIPDFCARYMIYASIGKSSVPDNLLPYEIERVKDIL